MFKRRYFVIAPSFHGATLLSKLLNDHPGVVSLGDTYPSNSFDQICGCGEYVSKCRFWQTIAERVDSERYRECAHLLPNYPTIAGRHLDRLIYNTFSPKILSKITRLSAQREFSETFESFVAAVYEQTERPEACVYVDGVKSIARVFALVAAGVRVDGIIHLYRDPGDYIKSTMKQESRSWPTFIRGLLSWRMFHNRARRMRKKIPYISLSYEGLADHPDESLRRLFEFIGVPRMPVADLVSGEKSHPWHFMGNASLFDFDGSIKRSRHELSIPERQALYLLAGSYSLDTVELENS